MTLSKETQDLLIGLALIRGLAAHKAQLLVGVDPGRQELLSMATLGGSVSEVTGERRAEHKLRYTRLQRRNETGTAHHTQRRLQLDASLWTNDGQVDERLRRRVRRAQEALSGTCGRASELARFGEYLEAKWLCLELCGAHLSRKLEYRALRYKAWAGRRRSENRLVRSIRAEFGRSAVLAIGDWSKAYRTSGFRGLAPTPGVGLRRRLARDFLVVGTPEAFTSQRCSECGSEIRPVAERRRVPTSKKRKAAAAAAAAAGRQEKEDEESKVDVRGLRQCVSTQCGIRWNRDLNSACCIVRNAVELARSGRLVYGRDCAPTRPTCVAPIRRPRAPVTGSGTAAVPVSGLEFPGSGCGSTNTPGGAGPVPSPCCVTI